MAEPVVPEIVEEPKVEKPAIKLDSTMPLNRQVDKLLSQLPAEEPKEEEPKEKEEEKAKEIVEDPKEEPSEEPKKEAEPENEPEEIKEVVELPPVAQYILDNLPELQALGHTGDGKDKIVKVKRLEDLPGDFEFASRMDELRFMASLQSQEINARDLLAKYQKEQQDQQVQQFLNQQALDVQTDIQQLQKEGILDKFKYESNDTRFDEDPAVKTSNEIYELFEKTNAAYARNGKSYRISYRDAADKYFAVQSRNQEKAPDKVEPPKPTPQQVERKEVATKVSAPQGADPNRTRPRLPSGSTMRDVLRLYNQGRI